MSRVPNSQPFSSRLRRQKSDLHQQDLLQRRDDLNPPRALPSSRWGESVAASVPVRDDCFSSGNRTRTPLTLGPRERLWGHGAEHLSEADLIALLLGTGSRQLSVETLATELLEQLGGVGQIADSSMSELGSFEGIGEVKAARLLAAAELGRRLGSRPWPRGVRFQGPQQVFDYFAPRLRDERREFFISASLDVRQRLIGEDMISCGSLVASIVHPREVFRPAIRRAAASLLVVHNHPSGDPTPSEEDWAVTERLRQAGELLGIELVDHLVIGEKSWVSLRSGSDRDRSFSTPG